MAHNVTRVSDQLTDKIEGPFAILRTCRICGHRISRRRGNGRGAGFREGNKQRGEMHTHIRTEHPKAFDEAHRIIAEDGWQYPGPILPLHDLKKLDNNEEQ